MADPIRPEPLSDAHHRRRHGWALACSVALHALVWTLRPAPTEPPPEPVAIAVELVTLDGPPPAPEPKLSREPAPAVHPARAPLAANRGAAPPRQIQPDRNAPPTPPDFDTKLRAQAGLLQSLGTSKGGIGKPGGSGTQSGYSVKDFIRAQIERRWNFNVPGLRTEPRPVQIRIMIEPNGVIDSAEIVDAPGTEQPDYHALAITARAAAVVASPIPLPPGILTGPTEMVLDLDPKSALR